MGYIYDALENYFVWNNAPDENIPQLMWHITNQCSLQCKFCFSIKNANEVPIYDLDKYITKFTNLKVQKIDLSGGEPMLYNFLQEICEALWKAGIYTTITTRGIGLSSNINWLLDKNQKFARIIVSVDAPTDRTFEELTCDKEGWNKTQNLLRQLKNKECNNVRINTVATTFLMDDLLLGQLVEIIESYNCKEWCLIETHPANKKDTFEEVSLIHNQFLQVVEKARKLWESKPGHHLLVREKENYTNYWVLYPNGTLSKHTNGEHDVGQLPFLDTKDDYILNTVKNKIWVPGMKHDIQINQY